LKNSAHKSWEKSLNKMEWKVPLADLDYGPEENKAVLDVMNSRWLTMGAITREFEDRFAQALQVRHAIAVSNATTALHLACLASNIGPGNEVIVPSLSFVATSNAVLYTGAQVKFADILGVDELTISPQEIEKSITPMTKAIIVMHYAGYPCHMAEIMDVASRNGLTVIEDAAHAPGAHIDGHSMGTWGDIGCFSFFSNKNLSIGEGGMVVTNRDDFAEKIRLMRSHGMTAQTWDRHQGHAYSYDVIELGYNYRLDEIRSALGLVQLRKLSQNNNSRKEITQKYWNAFQSTSLELPFMAYAQKEEISAAYHIFPSLLPNGLNREGFVESLRNAGIQTSVHYPPIHTFTYYQKRYPGLRLPHTEEVARREVTLPLYPHMSEKEVELVVKEVRKSLHSLAN
jgi:dTDP-4-amino-4,6-dideoxygalactose transaminase